MSHDHHHHAPLPMTLGDRAVEAQRATWVSVWVNLLLTILGYFPGLVHVIWLLAKK